MHDIYIPLVHWKTDDELPLWQLRRRGGLRVNLTSMFDSKFLITAIRELSDEEAIYLKGRMGAGDISCDPCGQGFKGYDDTIFKHTNMVGDGRGWHVTNNAMEAPAFTKYMVDGKIGKIRLGEDFRDHVAKHPNDGYTVQFENVPWGVFKRYWRKPINLDRRFHSSKLKSSWGKNRGYMIAHPAVDVLHVDMKLLRKHKYLFVDFHRSGRAHSHPKMTEWMLKHAKQFRTMSDDDSPFVQDVAEFLFTVEWMSRLP